jgi:hypothetical protein
MHGKGPSHSPSYFTPIRRLHEFLSMFLTTHSFQWGFEYKKQALVLLSSLLILHRPPWQCLAPTVVSLVLTNTVSAVRIGLSIWLERFRRSQSSLVVGFASHWLYSRQETKAPVKKYVGIGPWILLYISRMLRKYSAMSSLISNRQDTEALQKEYGGIGPWNLLYISRMLQKHSAMSSLSNSYTFTRIISFFYA